MFAILALLASPLQGRAEEIGDGVAEVILDTASDKVPIEVKLLILYVRKDGVQSILSNDEAADRAFGNVFIAYRMAAKEIPVSLLRSKKGPELLEKKVMEIIGKFNEFPYEPVVIIGLDTKNMTFNPDPESLGRPAMLYLGETSGDAEAGI